MATREVSVVRCFRVTDRKLSVRLPASESLVPSRILRPPGPPLALRVSSSPFFRTKSLRSVATFRSLSMVFVRALSAMPKVPLLRVIPFLASGLEACRVPSSLLPPAIVPPASALREARGNVPDDAMPGLLPVGWETVERVGLAVLLSATSFFTRDGADFVRTGGSLPLMEGVGLFAALPTVSREVMGLT